MRAFLWMFIRTLRRMLKLGKTPVSSVRPEWQPPESSPLGVGSGALNAVLRRRRLHAGDFGLVDRGAGPSLVAGWPASRKKSSIPPGVKAKRIRLGVAAVLRK